MRWPRTSGSGAPAPRSDRLEWDTKLYLALNGAVHDAAIAAWGLKGHYDSARPISLIRYMGGKGQSSDPSQPAYDPEGLPLEPGLVEVITSETTAPGQRHAALEGHEGEIAVRAWQAYPEEPEDRHRRRRAGAWRRVGPVPDEDVRDAGVPRLRLGPQHVQPRRGRGVTAMTGSEFFPGGQSGYTAKAGSLKFEKGPTADVPLQWATYFDAADQAGRSRLWGGIHIGADDLTGRRSDPRSGSRPGTPPGATTTGRPGRDPPRTPGARSPPWIVGVVAVVAARASWSSAGCRPPRDALGAPRFVEETATAGLAHTYDGGPTFATGGGVAVLDCDEDGRPDLYVAGGANAAAAVPQRAATSVGGLAFTPAGDAVTDVTGVTGAYPLDVDGDGHTDLAVLRVGETLMLRGLGDCRFERANEALGASTAVLGVDDRLLGDLGGGADPADARRRQLPRARSRG